jgi:lipoprotein-releasing system permease protein
MVAEIFAADPAYFRFCRMDTSLMAGVYSVADAELPVAMVSEGIRQSLQISFKEDFTFLKLAYPKRSKILKPGSGKIFNTLAMRPSGSLGLDENRVFAPLSAGRRLMERPQGCNFVDVFVKPGEDPEELAARIQNLLGTEIQVKNEYQLHEDLFKVMAIEKLFVFLALGFIILISGFNLFVSSSMMVLNKQKDFSIMSALGMEGSQFASIIRSAGMMLVLSGLIPGLAAGSLLCFIQMKFEIVPLGMSSTLVKAYPVELHLSDVLAIAGWVFFSGMLALFVPSRRAGLLKMQL